MGMKVFELDKDARRESWTYNPDGKTKEEQRQPGDDVTVILYNVSEENQLLGRVILKPFAHHGKVVAEESCYYYVISGSVDFYIYCDGNATPCGRPTTGCNPCCKKCTTDHRTLGVNEAIKIEKGTILDYSASINRASIDSVAEVMLFRNYAST